jgi:hypothetical protein
MFPCINDVPAEPKGPHTAEATALNPPANEVGAQERPVAGGLVTSSVGELRIGEARLEYK